MKKCLNERGIAASDFANTARIKAKFLSLARSGGGAISQSETNCVHAARLQQSNKSRVHLPSEYAGNFLHMFRGCNANAITFFTFETKQFQMSIHGFPAAMYQHNVLIVLNELRKRHKKRSVGGWII